MHCIWCHNPETLKPGPELQFFPEKCIGCGECFKQCPNQAHEIEDHKRRFHRALCRSCGICAKNCYAEALVLIGKSLSTEQVLAEVTADLKFYERSGGGVTLTGGEPFFQTDFTYEILKLCKVNGISTAIETNLAWPWDKIKSILPVVDLMMVDIKAMNDDIHKKVTGLSNAVVLKNLSDLSQTAIPIIIRTPVIPGVNDSSQEIEQIAQFISGFNNLRYYEFLPFHPLATGKYRSLGLEYALSGVKRPSRDILSHLATVARNQGITVRCPET